MALLQLGNAASTRFALETLPGAEVTAFAHSLADRVSSRDLAWVGLVVFALVTRHRQLLAAALVVRGAIELQDGVTLAISLIEGAQPAQMWFFVALVAVLIALDFAAARVALRSQA